jgi:hypothetical protein
MSWHRNLQAVQPMEPATRVTGFGMYYRFQLPEDDIRRFNTYQLVITYEDTKGETAGVAFVNSQPQLYAGDLANYVRFRKGETQP